MKTKIKQPETKKPSATPFFLSKESHGFFSAQSEDEKFIQKKSELDLSTPPLQMQPKEEEEEPFQMQQEEQETAQMRSTSNNLAPEQISSDTMPANVQSKMENSFGVNFNDVRIHKNESRATQLGALAYTQGNHIHFAPGKYNPGTTTGQNLLGHELTHVIQQRQGKVKGSQNKSDLNINTNKDLEHEADVLGAKAEQGTKNGVRVSPADKITNPKFVQLKSLREKIEEFQSKIYSETNFSSSTGSGLFNVSLNPINGRLEILVNVNFNFINGSAADFNGLKGQAKEWTKAETRKWKKDFIALIEGRWGGKYHFINPSLPGMTVYVDVEIGTVEKDWHYQLNVTKIPKGKFKGSSISHYIDASGKALKETNKHFGTLDSEDLNWADKGSKEKQKGAVHEFGHMIGLGDEYADAKPGITHASMVRTALGKVLAEGISDDIMSSGNSIEKQHYITFLEALQKITSDANWKYKP